MDNSKKIVVIGSSNTDMVIRTEKIPQIGETVLGGVFFMNPGGKGANQAVAASRLGGDVSFVGKVGQDIFGNEAIFNLRNEGINVEHLSQDAHFPSGIATITVDKNGQNSIVVAPGANEKIGVEDIDAAKDIIKASEIILVQLEIDLKTVVYSIKLAHSLGKKIILNPAPYMPIDDKDIFPYIHAITPNETEAESLTGIKITSVDSAREAALNLREKGVPVVVITMGEMGAYLLSDDYSELIETFKMEVVDTTAAGDTFNGAFAVAICDGKNLREAVKFANRAAAFSVTKIGAQSSCPSLDEVNECKFMQREKTV